MLEYTVIVINGNWDTLRIIYDQFADTIPKPLKVMSAYNYSGGALQFPVLDGSPVLQEVIQALQKNGFDTYDLFHRVYYTAKEQKEIPFFRAVMKYPLELEGVEPDYFGTQYAGGCPVCRKGIHLTGDILIDRKLMKKAEFAMLQPNYVVSERVKNLIEDYELTGVQFSAGVKDFKGREMGKYYVMELNELPPLSETAWFVPAPFKEKCGHRRIYIQSELRYEKEKLEYAKDFNVTKESHTNEFIQELVVSKRVKEVFTENKVFARYVPVHIL